MEPHLKRIVELVAEHDGEWGWYQLDRGLTMSGIVGVHVPSAVMSLRDAGLLNISGDAQSASSRYTLTAAGKRLLEAQSTRDGE